MECPTLCKSLIELLDFKPEEPPDFVNLMVTFAAREPSAKSENGSDQILENVPEVRIYFESAKEEEAADAKPAEEAPSAANPAYDDYGDESYY